MQYHACRAHLCSRSVGLRSLRQDKRHLLGCGRSSLHEATQRYQKSVNTIGVEHSRSTDRVDIT